MTTGTLIRLGALLSIVATLLAACTADQPRPEGARSDPTSAPGPAAAGAGAGIGCAEDDVACQERLYQLEETLFAYEAGVANRIGERAQGCWQTDVDAFRRVVDACGSVECSVAALLERIASLHPLQAAEHRADLALPETALLVAVLGPETEAGPPARGAELEVRGGLVHASTHPEQMGLAVRADDGQEHVFLFDIDIGNQPGHDEVLERVGTSAPTRVSVRGYREVAPGGAANFDTSRCRWVLRLP